MMIKKEKNMICMVKKSPTNDPYLISCGEIEKKDGEELLKRRERKICLCKTSLHHLLFSRRQWLSRSVFRLLISGLLWFSENKKNHS